MSQENANDGTAGDGRTPRYLSVDEITPEMVGMLTDDDAIALGAIEKRNIGDDPATPTWTMTGKGWRYETPREALVALMKERHASVGQSGNAILTTRSMSLDLYPKTRKVVEAWLADAGTSRRKIALWPRLDINGIEISAYSNTGTAVYHDSQLIPLEMWVNANEPDAVMFSIMRRMTEGISAMEEARRRPKSDNDSRGRSRST